MRALAQVLLSAALALSILPSTVWAQRCQADAPLLTTASSQDIGRPDVSFVVVARDKVPGCPPGSERLNITAAGLPEGAEFRVIRENLDEVAGQVRITGTTRPGDYNVTYTVTDSLSNTTSVSLPLRFGPEPNNSPPTLDPISDLALEPGPEPVSFTIGVSDLDGDLAISEETLVISGLPRSHGREVVHLTPERVAIRVTLFHQGGDRGSYRVHVRARDTSGGMSVAQFRITVQ